MGRDEAAQTGEVDGFHLAPRGMGAIPTSATEEDIDALDEFKEQTKTYSAEYGFSASAEPPHSSESVNNTACSQRRGRSSGFTISRAPLAPG